MNKSQERIRSLRLSGVLLVLATLVLIILPARGAFAQTSPKADYRLQNTRTTSVGTAPALQNILPGTNTFTTATVDDSLRKVLRFPKGNGLKLDTSRDLSSNGTYTIVVLFELDNVGGNLSRFRRVLDFKNGANDSGLYVEKDGETSTLSFYRQGGLGSIHGSTSIRANRYVQAVVSRDAGGTVRGYVDGTEQFSFVDDGVSPDATISSENTLRFFKDDGSEDSAGSVARIRLFDSALSETDVGALDRLEPTVFTVNSNADLADNNLVDGKCRTVNANECTLRAAVQQADKTSGNDTINFDPGSLSNTITLTQGHISIDNEPDSLTINGPKPEPGARILTVSGNSNSRVFRIADDASAVINRLKISNGKTTFSGGGISNDGDSLTLTNSTVSGNSANGEGGGIYNSGNALTLSKTTVSGNTSSDAGGGIRNVGLSDLTLTNSTFSDNSASTNGGGISNSGMMTLNNSTLTENGAGVEGGGVASNGSAILRNTIVANNTIGIGPGPDAIGTYSTEDKNFIGDTSGAVFVGSTVLSGNPRLGPLDNNGGSTDTHALLSGSPAVDRASSTGCPSADQRGVTRPRDGDGNGSARCDIGTYEKK